MLNVFELILIMFIILWFDKRIVELINIINNFNNTYIEINEKQNIETNKKNFDFKHLSTDEIKHLKDSMKENKDLMEKLGKL